ncbi:G5 domain-containing protein, partial [Streptococcus mitis]|uniref:pneumococcal collagen-like adhesin PclA n=1 Tax=Streptococcus mitis TaxID=28037 RepID=UPI000F68F9B2
MKHSHKKSFDWYSMQQRYSIRKYHFGAASVLLGTALVLGTAANAQSVQAEEQHPEATNSVSVDKVDEATKPAEVSTPKKETTYAAPTVANPVETTPAKTEEATRPAEKVEEAEDKKEEVTHQDAVDKSKLLTALSRAKKLESKLYTEASAANLQASIQAGQSLLGKADATEVELSAAESSIQSAIIGLELRSNSDKGTVSETPVVKKADAAEAKEEAKPVATTDRSAVDSTVLPTSTPVKVEATSRPASTNELLKPALSLSDARQNPAIRKEDLDKGHSGFRAASNPANPIVSGSGNTVAFTDISQGGRSYSFRGYGNSRGGNSIHYDVTTVRQGNRLNFTIRYSGPGEFVNNNFILDKGDGFGNPSNATITTPRLREQSKPISQGANFVSHSGYSMTSATSTNMEQTIRFSLPIINPNGDLSVRLKPVTFNVDQGGGGAATSNDPYSNSNYYYRANPLLLDANPNGGTSNKTVTEELEFQTIYLPTSKLPEGETRLVREGEKGQRQITYKVHRLGNETILGLPISNRVTKEAKPRIVQIGVAKEFIETVKPRVDQNKIGDTNNLTFYLDNDGNGVYTEGVDELVQRIAIKDGAKGEKGDQGERGLTGAQGAKGEKGDQGERGLTGAQGAKGEKGDQGERGLTGAKGEKGDRGERGLTGAQGAKGEKGDRGERGLTGAQGAKGEKGDQGERGLTGAQGAKGEKGDRGERGLTGAQGAKGEKGDRGERGLTGAQGAKGEKGDQGERGLTGAQGAKGEKGDQGERGLTGAKGEKGDQGERGLTGAKGEKGDRGERGLTGAKGEKGDRGERGLTGAKGEKGDQGERGLTGAKGEKGDQGERGLTGAKGEKGDQGERGLTGAKGEKGDQGERGLTGAQGAKGEKGDQGQAGRDGVTPTVTVKDNKEDGTHTITINDGRGNVTSTVVRDGFDGASPLVATQRNDADKTTTVIFYYDQNDNNEFDAGDTKLKEVVIADGAKGEKGDQGERGLTGAQGEKGDRGDRGETGAAGRDGKTPKITTARGADGRSTDITFTIPGEEPVVANIKDGKDGRTPTIDLNALAEAAARLNNQRSGRVRRALADAPSTAPAEKPREGTLITAYFDNNGNGRYDEGIDELIAKQPIYNGTDGANGAAGAAGRNGAELLSGPKAPTADDGKDGDTYIDATTGDVYKKENGTWDKIGNIRGPQGLKGEAGVAGPQGPQGLQGPKGEQGAQGLQGRDGAQGPAGRDGREGVPGPAGRDGRDGAQGPAGRDGRDGKDVLNGKVDPTTEGKDGDKYVNTETGDVFVKNNGNWEKEGNIKGPKGDKGAEGAQGPKGADGAQGLPGRDGRDGAQGPAGRDGRDGRDGKDVLNGKVDPTTEGKDGDKYVNTETGDVFVKNNGNWEKEGNIKGPKGDKGAEGAQGPKGADGAQGLPGRDGRDGAQGPAGRDGRDGRDGKDVLNGKVDPTTEGKDGDKYVNTETGDVFVKNNGNWEKEGNIKGPKGDKGAEGAQGPKGADGAQGLPGRDGRDGAQG